MSARQGAVRLDIDGELETASISVLRIELANIVSARPTKVELRVAEPERLGGAGWGLLRAFSDVLRARGCPVVLKD